MKTQLFGHIKKILNNYSPAARKDNFTLTCPHCREGEITIRKSDSLDEMLTKLNSHGTEIKMAQVLEVCERSRRRNFNLREADWGNAREIFERHGLEENFYCHGENCMRATLIFLVALMVISMIIFSISFFVRHGV